MDKKLKKIIFKKLYNDLSNVEIIQHGNSIWFIDRDKKFWYLEYQNGGNLYWRYQFFGEFFNLFSMEIDDYEQVIVDWVEEVLNCKVVTPGSFNKTITVVVEEVLNCKVVTPLRFSIPLQVAVEEVLNYKVVTPSRLKSFCDETVEEVLNYKVVTPVSSKDFVFVGVEEVLNGNVVM